MSRHTDVMTRRGFCAAGLAALAGLPAAARAGVAPDPVKIGLVGSLFREVPATLVLFAMQPFKDYIDGELGVSSRLVACGDPFALGQDLRDGRVHVGVFHGTEFAWAQAKYPKLRPLFIAVNGEPTLSAHLLVNARSSYRTVADLKGKSLTMPGRTREHCWMFLERRCVKPGVKPTSYYSSLRRVAAVDEALNQLAAGHCPAVLADGADLAAYRAENPARAEKLQAILSSEPLPCALGAVYDGTLDEGVIAKFRGGMLAAAGSPKGRELLKVMRLTSFQRVPDGFEKELEAAAKAYPPR